jgi:hypothetical protein
VLDEMSLNIRWNATWIPLGSSWLYNLADFMRWDVIKKSPNSALRVVFSWKSVLDLFSRAFATGCITLPISLVEGNTIVTIHENPEYETIIVVKESIDLVSEADSCRLENRRVAQELASWLDRCTTTPRCRARY